MIYIIDFSVNSFLNFNIKKTFSVYDMFRPLPKESLFYKTIQIFEFSLIHSVLLYFFVLILKSVIFVFKVRPV